MDKECNNVLAYYYNILSNNKEPRLLTEATINRILTKHSDSGFIIVSANRTDKTKKENDKNTKSLIADIRKSGYSYFPVYGGYKGTDGMVDKYEPSFFITNYKGKTLQDNFDELFDLAVELCNKYNQDSVLVKAPNDVPKYIDRNGEVVGKEKQNDKVSINRIEQKYFTALYKKDNGTKRMTYDMDFNMYLNPLPCTLNEAMRRQLSNEILLNDIIV